MKRLLTAIFALGLMVAIAGPAQANTLSSSKNECRFEAMVFSKGKLLRSRTYKVNVQVEFEYDLSGGDWRKRVRTVSANTSYRIAGTDKWYRTGGHKVGYTSYLYGNPKGRGDFGITNPRKTLTFNKASDWVGASSDFWVGIRADFRLTSEEKGAERRRLVKRPASCWAKLPSYTHI